MLKLQSTKDALLFFYNSLFSTDTDIEEDDYKEFDPHRIDNHHVNKVRQDMYRHLKIYVSVLSLIKDNIHIVEHNKNDEILGLFRLCFAFLTAFVKANQANQLTLANSLVVFLYNMSLNLGHVKLLKELFRDNFTLCTTRVKEVVDEFYKLIVSNGRRAEYLEFFEIIQCVKGEMVFENQRRVLDMFLDPLHKNVLLYFDKTARKSFRDLGNTTEEKKLNYANTFK